MKGGPTLTLTLTLAIIEGDSPREEDHFHLMGQSSQGRGSSKKKQQRGGGNSDYADHVDYSTYRSSSLGHMPGEEARGKTKAVPLFDSGGSPSWEHGSIPNEGPTSLSGRRVPRDASPTGPHRVERRAPGDASTIGPSSGSPALQARRPATLRY